MLCIEVEAFCSDIGATGPAAGLGQLPMPGGLPGSLSDTEENGCFVVQPFVAILSRFESNTKSKPAASRTIPNMKTVENH